MCISMPAVPAQRGGYAAAGAADSLARSIAQGAGHGSGPTTMKAYDCAHFQPQGR